MDEMDPFTRRVMGTIQSHLQTMFKQTDLRLEVRQVSFSAVEIFVWEKGKESPRLFTVEVTERI